MKRIFAVLAASIIGLSLVPSVSAQSAPPAQTLLKRMEGAFITNRTVHIDMVVNGSVSRLNTVATHVEADIATGSGVAIEHVTIHAASLQTPPRSTARDTRFVLVSGKAAIRSGKGWQCTTTLLVTRQYGNIFASLVPVLQKAAIVGTTIVAGIDTWHIHATTGASVPGQQLSLPTDLYVSRADSTLVKETSSGVMASRGHTVRESLSMLFSHYGEKVQAKLPAACLKKG